MKLLFQKPYKQRHVHIFTDDNNLVSLCGRGSKPLTIWDYKAKDVSCPRCKRILHVFRKIDKRQYAL